MSNYETISQLNSEACHLHNATSEVLKSQGNVPLHSLQDSANALIKKAHQLLPDRCLIVELKNFGGDEGCVPNAADLSAVTNIIFNEAYSECRKLRPEDF